MYVEAGLIGFVLGAGALLLAMALGVIISVIRK